MARRKDHSREEIKAMALTAAVEILNSEGTAALSARAIARRINYTVGTLYNVFTNFNDLVLHLNAQTMDKMRLAFTEILSTHGTETAPDPKLQIIKLTHTYIQFAHDNGPSWQLLFEARMNDEEPPEWYQHKISRLFGLVEQALLPLLKQSKVETAIAAKTLWASLYGICILSIAGKVQTILGETAQSLGTSLVENYIRGLCLDNQSSTVFG